MIASFFSGIGGFDLAFDRAEMSTSFQCEIDPNCFKLLTQRFTAAQRITDIRQLAAVLGRLNHGLPIVNYEKWKIIIERLRACLVFCGGFPCQDLSVAGARAGLAGERSGLWFTFRRIIGLIRPPWVVIENVPGLLSSNDGADLAVIFSGLEKLGYRWAYRTLDAQYFGLAQRRERVFIVASLGSFDCAEVLFERGSVLWDTPPSRETGKEVAACIRGGTENGSNEPGNKDQVTRPLRARHNSSLRDDSETFITMAHGQANAEIVSDGSPSLTTNHEAPIVFSVHSQNSNAMKPGTPARAAEPADIARSLDSTGGFSANQGGTVVAFSSKDSGGDAAEDVSPTLRAQNFKDSHINGGGQVAIAFQERGRPEGRTVEAQNELAYSLNSPHGGGRTQENVIAIASRDIPAVRHAAVEWRVNDDIIRTGKNPNGKRATAERIAQLKARNAEIVKVFTDPIAFDTTQVTSKGNYSSPQPGEPCHPLAAGAHPPAVAFKPSHFTRDKDGAPSEQTPPLSADADKGDQEAVVFQERYFTRDNKTGGAPSDKADITNCAKAGDSAPCVQTASCVRRLTPTECERLQGFPDGWTLYFHRGGQADIVVPCEPFADLKTADDRSLIVNVQSVSCTTRDSNEVEATTASLARTNPSTNARCVRGRLETMEQGVCAAGTTSHGSVTEILFNQKRIWTPKEKFDAADHKFISQSQRLRLAGSYSEENLSTILTWMSAMISLKISTFVPTGRSICKCMIHWNEPEHCLSTGPGELFLRTAGIGRFSDSVRYRMLGNAVAVPVVEWIARRLKKFIDQPSNPVYQSPQMNDETAVRLLTKLVKGCCLYPDQCEMPFGNGTLTIIPRREDYAIINGKKGRQIRAFQFIGSKMGISVALQDSYIGERSSRPFEQNPQFDIPDLIEFMSEFCTACFGRQISIRHTRDVDTLRVELAVSPDESVIASALSDIFYPYGYHNGMVVKICASASERQPALK